MLEWARTFGEKLRPYIPDTGRYLREAQRAGRRVLFEAQLGALRTSISASIRTPHPPRPWRRTRPWAPGAPGTKLDEVIGVVKAYSTCVGEGPFTAEWFGPEAERLREAGAEYGAATGRPRRVGPLDLVATRYGVAMQAATSIALTKLDVLSYMERIPVCTRYLLDGTETDEFPYPAALAAGKARV